MRIFLFLLAVLAAPAPLSTGDIPKKVKLKTARQLREILSGVGVPFSLEAEVDELRRLVVDHDALERYGELDHVKRKARRARNAHKLAQKMREMSTEEKEDRQAIMAAAREGRPLDAGMKARSLFREQDKNEDLKLDIGEMQEWIGGVIKQAADKNGGEAPMSTQQMYELIDEDRVRIRRAIRAASAWPP